MCFVHFLEDLRIPFFSRFTDLYQEKIVASQISSLLIPYREFELVRSSAVSVQFYVMLYNCTYTVVGLLSIQDFEIQIYPKTDKRIQSCRNSLFVDIFIEGLINCFMDGKTRGPTTHILADQLTLS